MIYIYIYKPICDQVCQKGSYTHSFKTCFLSPAVSYINAPTVHVLKVEQSAFTQTFFFYLYGVHKCLGGLQMVLSSLGKQTANCQSPHDWLMSLDMDLAALCDMWRWKWHQWKSFPYFSEYVDFACHFVATRQPFTLPSYRSVSGIGYASKNYLKWRENQLALQCTVDKMNYFE